MPQRRGNGDGSIDLRKDGRWRARLRYQDPITGLSERAYFYGSSRKEAADKLRAGQNRLSRREPARDPAIRLDEFLDRWLSDVVKPSLRGTTYRSYSITVDNHLKPSRIGHMKLRDLNEAAIQHVFLTKNKAPTRTQVLTLVVLRRALDRAVQWRILERNPAKGVALPRQERPERHPLTVEQVRKFLKAAESDRLYALYYLALDTGMRQGELLALQWGDVVNGTIRVNRSIDPHALKITAPKTRAGRRAITLDTAALGVLRAHKARQKVAGYSGPLIFPDRDGGPLRPSNYQRRSFKPLLEKAGVSTAVRFHDLRHTAATLMLAAGVNPKIASERLGHANIAITMDFYQHVSTDLQRTASSAFSTMLAGRSRIKRRSTVGSRSGGQSVKRRPSQKKKASR